MRSHSRFDSGFAPGEALLPSEILLVVQTTALAIFSSWTLGGMERWSQNWILVLALLGLPLVVLRYRETREFAWHPFVPALLWCVFTGLALANPSHVWLLGRGWAPRDDWIRWLPVTVDRPHSVMDARIWLSALLQGGILRSVLRSTRAAKLIWGAVALNAFALAVTGAVFYFSGAQQVLGFIEPPEKTYFFSTFFYKNHWAAFGALGGVAALALSLRQGRAALRGDPVARGRMMLFAAVGMLILITLPLPGSRSGVR